MDEVEVGPAVAVVVGAEDCDDDDEHEVEPDPLRPGEGAIEGLPGATYVSRALSPVFAYRLARNARKVGVKPARYGITGKGGPKVLPYGARTYPDWLEELVDRLLALGAMAQRPTQVSVNHYVPHPEPYRLVPHIDSKQGQVVIVSLLSYCCLDFYRDSGRQDLSVPFTPTLVLNPKDTQEPAVSLLLEPGSALILTGEAYREFGHGIAPRLTDDVNEKLGNYRLLTTLDKDATTHTTRAARISLALWSPE